MNQFKNKGATISWKPKSPTSSLPPHEGLFLTGAHSFPSLLIVLTSCYAIYLKAFVSLYNTPKSIQKFSIGIIIPKVFFRVLLLSFDIVIHIAVYN